MAKKKAPAKKPQAEQRFKHFGRPSIYSDELAEYICAKLASGVPLVTICEGAGMPGITTIFRWLNEADEEKRSFRESYARAREAFAHKLVADMLQICDDGRNDTITDDEGNVLTDYDHIQRSKLRADKRQWLASRLLPREFGDRQLIETVNLDDPTGDVEIE